MTEHEQQEGLLVAREFIPARVRRAVYAAAALAGYALTAAAVGFAAAGATVPTPVPVALGVLGSLIGPLGQLAAVNTPAEDYGPDHV